MTNSQNTQQPNKAQHIPTQSTDWNEPLPFKVWANQNSTIEDKSWRVVAAFDYLLEALDYISNCNSRGASVVFQSPNGVEIKPC